MNTRRSASHSNNAENMEVREERYLSRVWRCGRIIKSHPLSLLQKPKSGSLHLATRLYPVSHLRNRARGGKSCECSGKERHFAAAEGNHLIHFWVFTSVRLRSQGRSQKWKTATAPSSLASVLEQSDDWVLQVDLTIPGDGQKKNTPFPAHIGDGESAFSSRPDLIIFSDKLKHILYIELTSPWEGPRMEESHKEKMEKYRTAGLHSIPGWSTTLLCVEVGARGTTSNTFHHMCKALGMSSRESKRLGKKARTVAARCSYFIFLSRKVTEWDPRRPYVRC